MQQLKTEKQAEKRKYIGLVKELNPKYKIKDVALAYYSYVSSAGAEFPRVVIGDGETPDKVIPKLIRAMLTPTNRTENQLPGMNEYVKKLYRKMPNDSWMILDSAALDLIFAVRGKDEGFSIYTDRGREVLQYAGDFPKKLRRQFGNEWVRTARKQHPEFFEVFGQFEKEVQKLGRLWEKKNQEISAK
ncbi:MAG: hypothetical protein KGH49_00525 [Candidatus Micrarchaeota archaeon]|nr:hypothetical protein [Candidatus Micrarchaeota archaeon]